MSKIARVFHLNKEIQKIYKNGVLQKLFFDWKHYIGEEINIEHAKECAGRNVVINGKTYQNLVSNLNELVGNVYTVKSNAKVKANLLKINTTYTFVISLSEANYSDTNFGAIIVVNYPTLSPSYINISRKNGILKKKYTVKEEIPKSISISPHANNDTSSSFKLENLIILEGDYTHIDLPNSINGIESVGKREFVKSKNLYNKNFMNSTMVSKGEVIDSRGFTFTLVDNCTFKINGTNTTGCTIMSKNILDLLEDGKSYILSTNLLYFMASITYNDDTPQKWTSVFTVNKSVMNSIILYNQWKDTDIVSYNNFVVKNQIEEGTTATEYEPFYEYYPVTIKNYNYKCETDGIVLPNGVKNSIDTIDGKKVHVQRVWKRVFDGSDDEKWRNGYGNGDGKNNRFEMEISSKGSYSNTYMNLNIVASVCSHFKYEITNSIPKSFGHYRISFNNSLEKIFLLFNPSTNIVPLEDISAWKTWLSENPVTVWYELATPLYTYLESGLYDEITIPTSGIKNEIYSENGKWYHKRNIGKVIFDGSSDEKWSHYKEGSWARFDIKMPNDAKMYNVRTPVYAVGYRFEASKNENKIIFISGVETVNRLYIYNYAYTSIEDFKAYLAENPLEVYYELAEPVISELYFTDITYKLNEPLRSLPNGVYDTIEENRLVQRVGKVVLDGSNTTLFTHTLDTQNSLTTTVRFYITVSSSIFNCVDNTVDSNNIFMANFPLRNGAHGDYEYIAVQVMSASSVYKIFLNINRDKLESVDVGGLKKWLEQTPITIYYPLATPIETEITPDMILINGEPITDTVNIELPDGTKDSIENDCYVKRVEKIIFDENITPYQTLMIVNNNVIIRTRKFSMAIGDSNIISNATVISWMHDKNNLEEVTETKIMAISSVSGWNEANIIIPSSYFEGDITIEVVKEFLAENPVIMYYELATPIKIPLFSIKEGLTTLKSINNITPQIELDCLVRDDFQNMCDNEWEVGDIVYGTGEIDDTNSSRIRLINYIKVKPNTKYRMDILNSVKTLNEGYIGARYYDNEKSYLGGGSIGAISKSSIVFTTPENCYYIRFIAETTDVNFKVYLKEVIK